MAEFVYEIDTEHNVYPNMTVYKRYLEGVWSGWSIFANDGYVFYNANANDTEYDPETDTETPVTYYYTQTHKPTRYNWANFALVAVPRGSVDENYIFGAGDNDHEVM